jgi:hypothetical protein
MATVTIPAETLNRLTPGALARIGELVRDEPCEASMRGALALVIVADILGRALTHSDPAQVAEDVNITLAAHNLAWRLVPVS